MLPLWTLAVPALIGLWALSCWLYENLKSLVQIVIAVLTPYFVPAENKSLVERFGKWAGKRARLIRGSVLWSTETIGLHFPRTSINYLSIVLFLLLIVHMYV